MSAQDNGGSAFPQTGTQWVPDIEAREVTCIAGGMTLRDYFAAKALPGLLAEPSLKATPTEFAAMAYELADAMLKERAK